MMTWEELMAYNRNRRICQIGFDTTEDKLEETLTNWVEKAGVGPWKVFRKRYKNTNNGMIIALAMFGNTEVEVVALTGDWAKKNEEKLKQHGSCFSHFKEYCPSEARAKKEKDFKSWGVEVLPRMVYPINEKWPDEAWFVRTEEYISFRLELGNFAFLSEETLTQEDTDWYWFPAIRK